MFKLKPNAINLTGQKFNRLTALIPVSSNSYGVYWKCKCDCGKITIILANKIIKGKTKSCGCLLKEHAQKRNYKGKNNPNYINGKTKGNKCIDCGKHISLMSKRCQDCKSKGKNNPRFGKIANHGKGKKYKGIYMRSSWEIAYAKYLDKQGTKWQYEPKTFDLGNSTYTPDFYLPDSDTYVEIKGWWRDDAKKKFKMFQKKYCSMNIILLMQKELKKLKVIK